MLNDEQRAAVLAVMAPMHARKDPEDRMVINGARVLVDRFRFQDQEALEAAEDLAMTEFPDW